MKPSHRTARAYVKRITFCYTPKHGSWLHVAACELSCLTSPCISGRRVGALTALLTEIGAWSDKTNAKQRGVDWQFRIENARVQLKRLYPKSRLDDALGPPPGLPTGSARGIFMEAWCR
jgi:hypothetical protein